MYFRHACGIEVPPGDYIVITGGADKTRVQKYSTLGETQQLPDLKQGRYAHACSYYFNITDVVSIAIDTQRYVENTNEQFNIFQGAFGHWRCPQWTEFGFY